MPRSYRLGTALLAVCGLGLTALMLYALGLPWVGGWSSPGRTVDAEVDVFFPDPEDWRLLRKAALACTGRELASLVEEDDLTITLATRSHGRRIRFRYRGIRGHLETRAEVRRLFEETPPPVAIVGSENTNLTVALAEELDGIFRDRASDRPALLIPFATAVLTRRNRKDTAPVPLLQIYPDRSFRFCANDQRQADLVTDALRTQDPDAPPAQVHLVVDPRDPYSVDLADCFQRSIRAFAPKTVISLRPDVVGTPRLSIRPTANAIPTEAEQKLADEVTRSLSDIREGHSCWVVLPLLSEPARQMLTALRRNVPGPPVPGEGEGGLRVICGDGIGVETLQELESGSGFPIWSISSEFDPPAELRVTNDTQIPAEIVSALMLTLDQPAETALDGSAVVDGLRRIRLPVKDPNAFGRPLSFDEGGERAEDGGGQVHALRIDPARVVTYVKAGEDWVENPAKSPAATGTGR